MESPRRRFVRDLGLYAILGFLFERDLFAASVAPAAHGWLADLQEASRGLLGGRLEPAEWQQRVEALLGGVELPELLRLVDLDRLEKEIEKPVDRAGFRSVVLPEVAGLPAFATKVFALRKGAAIVPHGHRNMVSMHVLLAGSVHLRHFDRVGEETAHVLIRPTIDRRAGPGDLSSISDRRDNVHWFRATSEAAFTLDVIVDNLDPGLGYRYRMDFLDPLHGERAEGGLIRARRISFEEAIALYGRSA